MMNKVLDKMIYTGDVKIKTRSHISQIHNEGTANLFELFAQALVGEVPADQLPTFIDLRTEQNETLLNDLIPIYKQRRQTTCVINAAIKQSNLADHSNVTDNSTFYLHLLSNNSPSNLAKRTLAKLTVKGSLINQINSGRQALIEWNLYVGNATEGV